MSKQFNAIIADQAVEFTGVTSISIPTSLMPNFRAITGSAYGVNVTGGVSGTFGVYVIGSIGGSTYTIAGLTTVAAGTQILYPAQYENDGSESLLETIVGVTTTRLDQLVPPSRVVFEVTGGDADATGVSANITVSAVIYAD